MFLTELPIEILIHICQLKKVFHFNKFIISNLNQLKKLPKSYWISVKFSKDVLKPIGEWPDNLQQITFGSDFDKSITECKWPKSLQRIIIGRKIIDIPRG